MMPQRWKTELVGAAKDLARRVLPKPVYRVIRRRRAAHQIQRWHPREHVGSYGGRELRLRFEDPLAAGWYGHDWPVLPEVALLRELGVLTEGARVFDLGAHQGLVALMLAAEVGPTGRVVAVEAEPHNARVAEINRRLNDAGQLEIVHAAVGAHDGTLRFAEGLNGHVDESTRLGTVEVPAVTIDTLAARYGSPDLVFMDVEGFEGVALQAATTVLASDAAFFVEVHGEDLVHISPRDLVDLFQGRRRWIASRVGDEYGAFAEYDGITPSGRFFLIAARETA